MTCVVCPALATAFPANRRMSADDYAPPNGYASRVHQRYHGLQAPRGKRSSLAGQSGHRADDRAHAANSSVVVGRESFRFDVCARGWRAAKWRKSAAGPHPSPMGRLPMAANHKIAQQQPEFQTLEIEASASLIKKVTEEAGARGLSASQLCIYRLLPHSLLLSAARVQDPSRTTKDGDAN